MSGALEVVRAGAGSGKTTDLCDVVARAVEEGLDPARILATTFTRKAAVQLKGRVQARLLKSAASEPAVAHQRADRLELAAIGTVHSVAHQLITRYAIAMGLSPRLTVLDEYGSDSALNDLLGEIAEDGWEEVYNLSDCLSLDGVPNLILKLLALQRGNLISDDQLRQQLVASAERLCQLLAPQVGHDGVTFERLYELVRDALQQIENISIDTTQTTQKAAEQLRRLAAQRAKTWKCHVVASGITAGKRSGADNVLTTLRAEAARVRTHKELHDQVRSISTCIARHTAELGQRYLAYKQERGLVDFTDLEVLLLQLLETEELFESLRSDYDLVLVDEFQDTNPLQLAIFQRLRKLAPRSRWVGDPKQAIYGFRDADPELVNVVWENAADAQRTSLPKNYRAQKGLVELVGALFDPIFGADAVQEHHLDALPRGIERWLLDVTNQTDESMAICCGIAQLVNEGRAYRDIALLARTNQQLMQVASAMDELEIPYLLESPGLLTTREGALVLAGLRLVADRGDSLAAATILHLLDDPEVETPAWFAERLAALRNPTPTDEQNSNYSLPWEDDIRLKPLECIDPRTLPPTAVVQRVIEAVRAAELVVRWGDPSRRGAHLDSLLQHSAEYEQSALDEGRAATLTGLILYLENLELEEKDLRHAPLGHNAVTLLTYHTAKGLEWPVVVLCQLDYSRDPDLWSPAVFASGIDNDAPLHGRSIRYWSWPFGITDGEYARKVKGSGLDEDATISPEGQAKARSEAAESLRLLYVGFTRARNKLVLAHRVSKYSWLSQLANIDTLLSSQLGEGEHPIERIDTTLVIRKLNPRLAEDCRRARGDTERWFAPAEPLPAANFVERYHLPSASIATVDGAAFNLMQLSEQAYFPSGAREEHFAAIGDAVHAYLAALPSLSEASAEIKLRVANRCIAGFAVSAFLTAEALVAQGERFCTWVNSEFPGATWHTEVPVSAPRAGGGQWIGAIDLLIETTDDKIALIDHKSAPIRREHCEQKAATFSGQLGAYHEILSAIGKNVVAAYIHFPLAGVVCRQTLQGP